jgi:sortase A
MATQPRSSRPSNNQDALDLLQALIETPPAPPDARLQPISLRSTVEQRRHALGRYALRTWVDRLLRHAERLLMLFTLVFFGYWFVDGPLHDWLHEWQQPRRSAPVASAADLPSPSTPHARPREPGPEHRLGIPQPNTDTRLSLVVPLPYTTPDMAHSAPESDFIAPRGRAPAAPVATSPQPTRLLIPSLALDTPVEEVFVVDGTWQVADYAAGYLHDTGVPGEPGNTVLAGHAGLRGGVFRDLGALAAGNDIYLDAAGWRYHYRVRESKNVWPTQVEVLAPTDTAVLTLLTCTNWDTQRLVVVADLVDSKPSPAA